MKTNNIIPCILIVTTFLFTVSSVQPVFAQSVTASSDAVPSPYCLGSCPTEPPSNAPISTAPISASPAQTISSPVISSGNTSPTINPCPTEGSTSVLSHGKHRKKNGSFSRLLMKFFEFLIELLMKLFTGGTLPPQAPSTPEPTPVVDPCAPLPTAQIEPTDEPSPTNPITSTAPVTTSTPTTAIIPTSLATPGVPAGTRPIVLVYRGPGTSCCSEPLAKMIQNDTKWNFDIRYVGPNESLSVQAGLALPGAKMYAQPGADGDVRDAYATQKGDETAIKTFLTSGGRVMGMCMGGYLLGATYGFDLIPSGDADEYIFSKGADWTTENDTALKVTWRGKARTIYFQDGNYFTVDATPGVIKLATYANGLTAAMVAPAGKGKVGGSGPHPELSGAGATTNQDLGNDLIDTLMN